MAVNWSLYEQLLSNGTTTDKQEIIINESVNSFVSGMVDDPAYQKDAIVGGKATPIIASRKSTIACSIKAPPLTAINIGDIVECIGERWIVVELFADKVGIINGEMWLCNNVLRFQNRSIEIINRHCVVDNGAYSKRESDPDAAILANTYSVYIPIDDETRKLFVDKRLSLGQIYSASGVLILEAYKIIGIDVKSKNFGEGSHLMVLTLQRDVYDEQSDSLEENICDIFVANGDIADVRPEGNCVINGRDVIRLGTSRKYTASFTNVNGDVILDVVPTWNISVPSGVTYVASGLECVINVPLDEKLVGETITIVASDADNMLGSYEKKVQVITVG